MDLDRIHELLKLMESHNLDELEVEDKGFKVRLKKAQPAVPAPPPAAAPSHHSASNPGVEHATLAGHEAGAPADVHKITSPIVGTFYRAPSPEAEPFVDLGDPVDPETVVGIVEAMKVMNEVKAEVQGTIRKILIENGRPVEYGQPLFHVAK